MALKLKKLLGEAGAGLDSSHGSKTLYDVLKQLVTDVLFGRKHYLNAYQAAASVAVIGGFVADGPMLVTEFRGAVAVCGSANTTTGRLLKNGSATNMPTLSWAHGDTDGTVKSSGALAVALVAGDVLTIDVSAAATDATGVSLCAVLQPNAEALAVTVE